MPRGVVAPPAVVKLLSRLPLPGLEPRLSWDWDPTAFEPLAHPVPDDFAWRHRELAKSNLPDLVRARLNLELAFLGAAHRDGPLELRRIANPDSMSSEARALRSRDAYLRLLETAPDNGEFRTDLGDLYRFLGQPDSAIVQYRRALMSARPPARLFSRLANAELEQLIQNPSAGTQSEFRNVLARGMAHFAGAAPTDPRRAARFHLERAKFRVDRAVLEVQADRAMRKEAWRQAGPDSTFALMARVVAPETRRAFQAAAESDTNLAEAHGWLGTVVTGQIYLPITAEGWLTRSTMTSRDTLAAALWKLAVRRRAQRSGDAAYAAANLNRCEALEPTRFPRARAEQARLAVILDDLDGSAGLWRALMVRDPENIETYAAELFTTHSLEGAAGLETDLPSAGRVERGISEALREKTGAYGANNSEAVTLLGILRGELGRPEEAWRDLSRSAAFDTTDWRARLGLAVLSLHEMDAPAAEPHLAYAGRHFGQLDEPARGIYCGAVGLLYAARRDTVNARRWLDEAVRFNPAEPVLREAARSLDAGP
ncbi:MAG TPA: tetratricopeptide repeat protein [Candidatus Eisenbacteria bacterium]